MTEILYDKDYAHMRSQLVRNSNPELHSRLEGVVRESAKFTSELYVLKAIDELFWKDPSNRKITQDTFFTMNRELEFLDSKINTLSSQYAATCADVMREYPKCINVIDAYQRFFPNRTNAIALRHIRNADMPPDLSDEIKAQADEIRVKAEEIMIRDGITCKRPENLITVPEARAKLLAVAQASVTEEAQSR